MPIERDPIRKIREGFEALQRTLRNTKRKVDRAVVRGVVGTYDAFNDGLHAGNRKIAEAVSNLYDKILHKQINEGDTLRGSVPTKGRLDTEFDTSKVDTVLEKLGLKAFDEQDAINFFDQDTKYWKMTPGNKILQDSLKHFGVEDSASGDRRFASSLAHKDFIRAEMGKVVSKKLPKDEKQRNKVLAFQAFVFANAKLLIGPVEYQEERYKGYLDSAIKNNNLASLVMMKELTGIDFTKLYPNEAAFEKAVKKAEALKDSPIATYLKTQSIEDTFTS